MEAEYALLGYIVGMIVGVGGYFFFCGQQEGNRQDYITKIGLLKKEIYLLEAKCERFESYLTTSEDQCKERRNELIEMSRELQSAQEENMALKKEIIEVRSGLKMYRKAAHV